MATRGNPQRAFWLMVVGFLLISGGILAFLGVRTAMDQRIAERTAMEANAARTGTDAPPGPSLELLRREIRVIPYLMLIFSFGGTVLFLMGLAERRGIRASGPVLHSSPAAEKSDSP